MKTKSIILPGLPAWLLYGARLHARIFVANSGNGSIGEYSTTGMAVGSGTLIAEPVRPAIETNCIVSSEK